MYKLYYKIYFIAIFFIWHLFMLVIFLSPKVNDIYYNYFITGLYDKWNRADVFNYTYGDTINFKKGGNSGDFIWGGFSNQEKWGTWTCSDKSFIILKMDLNLNDNLCINIIALPFVNEKLHKQYINIKVNNLLIKKYLFDYRFSGDKILTINVPKSIIKPSNNIIKLEIDTINPSSPYDLNISDDKRKLGLGIIKLYISKN